MYQLNPLFPLDPLLLKQYSYTLIFTSILILTGCNGPTAINSNSSVKEVEFELQDFPVNSNLYSYSDSASLKKAMASFNLEPGLRIELIAAEPLVIDPSAFAFDEDNVMYVAENRGYPDPVEGGAISTQGIISRLEDKDGDGRMDHRTDFATGLSYPNGIMPWKGGVFVTCAPDIFYLKDTTGDGVADITKTVLTGFNADKTAQIRTSHPILGLDGWIYVTSGLNGGEVYSPEHPERPPVKFTASDGRFHPETFEFQTTGGRSQFGLTFDPYGHRFGSSNRHPVQHIVIEPRYLKRNPHLLFNETIENVAKAEAEAKVFPISNSVTSADFIPKLIGLSHKGTFTSACGLLIYHGTGMKKEHQGNVFICEPAQNLVQRQTVHPEGVTFRAELPYEGREFLASTDSWFNPVFLTHGPSGAIYLADMYRKVIDHPSYVPEEARVNLDFESGKDKGRIYRIVSDDFNQKKALSKLPVLSSMATIDQLLEAIESPEEWHRATAFRLLLEQKDHTFAPKLQDIAEGAGLPESRTRALWLLHALQELKVSTIRNAMADKESGVREQAILMIEEMLPANPELVEILIQGSKDQSARVRFTSALILGASQDAKVIAALAHIAAQDGADRWTRAAVLSGIGDGLQGFLNEFRAQSQADPISSAAMMKDLGQVFGHGATLEESRSLFKEIINEEGGLDWRMSTALGLLEGISGRREVQVHKSGWFYALLGEDPLEDDLLNLERFLQDIGHRALDNNESARSRKVAAGLLGYVTFENSGTVLKELMDAKNPPEIQLEAVGALSRLGERKGAELLTTEKAWSSYTPRVKSAVVSALVSKPEFVQVLFEAIEKKLISPAEISSNSRQRLINDKDSKISDKASKLFDELEAGGRMQVYEKYRVILNKPADASLGKTVFQRSCSACHTYAGEGGDVGPDLTGVNNQPADALLLHTLVPNYEVLPVYQAITIETTDGRSISGWILAETDNSMTLRTAFGTEESILRSNIVSIDNSGLSLMPDGLEQTMTKEDMANLIAYLKSGG